MADALALRVISDARWPEGTTFRLPPGCDLRIGEEHDFEISLGSYNTPAFDRRHARVTATKAGTIEIHSDRMMDEIFIDDRRTYRKALARGQRIALGASKLEVIDAELDAAKMRGCPACGAPLDFLPRPLPGCAGCNACRALIRVHDGTLEAAGSVRVRFEETLRRAVDEGSVDSWAEIVREDPALPDWMLELDDLVLPAKPWLDTFRGRFGVLLEDTPLEPYSGAHHSPHLRFRAAAPGSASDALEWVARGARLRVESATVRWLIVHIPVTELRVRGNAKVSRNPKAPGLLARCPWSLLRLLGPG